MEKQILRDKSHLCSTEEMLSCNSGSKWLWAEAGILRAADALKGRGLWIHNVIRMRLHSYCLILELSASSSALRPPAPRIVQIKNSQIQQIPSKQASKQQQQSTTLKCKTLQFSSRLKIVQLCGGVTLRSRYPGRKWEWVVCVILKDAKKYVHKEGSLYNNGCTS